jgi:hypothetical protein
VVVIVCLLELQLHVQSMPITNKDVSLNCAHWRVVQHYVIKFVSDLRQVGGLLWYP